MLSTKIYTYNVNISVDDLYLRYEQSAIQCIH